MQSFSGPVLTMPIHEGSWWKRRLKDKGFTQEEFAEKLGVSRNTLLILLKEAEISAKYRPTVMTLLDATDEDIERAAMLNEPTSGYYTPYNGVARSNGDRANMWIVTAKAQAGFIQGFAKREFSHQIERVRFPMIKGECFCIEIEGFSMYPDHVPGSFVISTLLEDWNWMRKGKIYVYQTDEGLIVKCYEGIVNDMLFLSSSNTAHNPVEPVAMSEVKQIYNIEFKVERP